VIEIRPARPNDSPEPGEMLAIGLSHGAMVACDAAGPLCFWGFVPDALLGDRVYMWFHPERDVATHRIKFLRENRRYLQQVLETYPVVYGSVDVYDLKAVKWLRWLGFKTVGSFEFRGKTYDQIELRADHGT
jgi:hypothetical protein